MEILFRILGTGLEAAIAKESTPSSFFCGASAHASDLSAGQFRLVSLGLAGTIFIRLDECARARWGVAFRRVPGSDEGHVAVRRGAALLTPLFHRCLIPGLPRLWGWPFLA